MRLRKLLVVSATLAILLTVPVAQALAYGHADQPLAQVELSANCNNPSFSLCQEVGTGGIWLWIEIDANGTGDVAGAGCGHTVGGVGGPGGAGAGSIKGEVNWIYTNGAGIPPGTFAFFQDPSDTYYLVTLASGDVFAFPVTQGHYSFSPAKAVTVQLQIAP